MAELKPCPFCGATPRIVTRNVEPQGDPWYGLKDETFVLCNCGACLFDGGFHEGFWDAETRAVEAWNRRTSIGDTPAPQSTEGGEGVPSSAPADPFTVSAALRRLIADDAYAMTFQTFGQYRTALLRAIDGAESAAGVPGLDQPQQQGGA